jgi:hypothetical protein
MSLFEKINAYESGEGMEPDQIDEFFQELVDTGMAWKLQGHYGRTAVDLIRAGRVGINGQKYPRVDVSAVPLRF